MIRTGKYIKRRLRTCREKDTGAMKAVDAAAQQRSRVLKAVAFVLFIALMIPGVDAIMQFVVPSVSACTGSEGIDALNLRESGDIFAFLNRLEDAATESKAEVPGVFANEVGFLPEARDIRVNQAGTIIGYIVSLDSTVAFQQLSNQFHANGWKAISLGDIEGATFIKRTGYYTRVLATCTQVGEATSVVLRCDTR